MHTICMAQYALYTTSHPCFMTSNHSTQDIKDTLSHITPIISDSSSTVSVSSHPDYWSYNAHCMYITATIGMTSHELYMTSHPFFMISHHSLTSQPLYSCHHTQYIWHHIHCGCLITHSVFIIAHLFYVWHQTHSMTSYEFYMTSHPLTMISQDYIHDITSTLFMTSHPLYMRSYTLYLWHHSQCIYDKTPTMFMTS